MQSPPSTPGPSNPPPRSPSLTPSDDSSIIELSFDYQFDDDGNYVRVSKGSSSHSSPPTPESPQRKSTTPTLRRSSLSRSESYPIVTAAEQRPQGLPRSFQRVVSGPVLSSITTGTATVRGSNRKLGTRVLPAAASAQRVTIEQYREMDDKVRLENEEMRLTVREEEKENITDVVPDGQGVVLHPTTTQAHPQPKHHRPSGLSPRLLQPRSASISGLPSRASSASLSSIPNNVSSTGRQILPGPNRAGRILVGAKYTTTTSTSAPASASAVGITGSGLGFDRISEVETSDDGVGAGTGASGLAGVLEFYAAEDDDLPSPPLPPSLPPPPPPASAPAAAPPISNINNAAVKHRSYAGIPGSTAGGSAGNQSGNTRPRRSASLSDAGAEERLYSPRQHQHQHHPPCSYMSRPGSSLGINSSSVHGNGNGNVNANGINGVNGGGGGMIRARRVTMEEKYRQEREREAELEEYERRLAEDAAVAAAEAEVEAERRTQQTHEDSQQQQHRKSPSPTHLTLASQHSHLKPSGSSSTVYTHQRRDSDTLRNIPTTQSGLGPSSSPTAVDHGYVNGYGHGHKLSPPTRNFPNSTSGLGLSNSQTRVGQGLSHKRSPTAPEVSTTGGLFAGGAKGGIRKSWGGAADEEEFGVESERERDRERERERGKSVEREREKEAARTATVRQQPRPTSAPAPPPATAAQAAQAPVPNRQLFVNKKVYARLDMIGKGGSSRVYRVMNASNEIYAIKRVSLDKTDADTMSGYMNEIALLKRLDGNNRIIKLMDSELRAGPGGSKGHLLLVMECGEIDLARLLQEQQKEPMNMVWISYYWQQMLQAVHVIHEEKIVHSDLKPANFVLVRGQLKLIDFGIANAIANDTTNIQRDHQIGTVNYMSPEAIELPDGMRRLKVGRPSDVWSLGCILYQMVYGHPPFQHLSVFQKMKAIPDLAHIIDFPQYSTPSIPTRSSGSTTPPKRLDHLKRRVRGDVIMSMKSCLCRNPKERAAIPELLDQDWLAMKELEPRAAKPELAQDETIINPYYMRQLLSYGIKLGQQTRNADMDPDDLLKEAERLVAELKALET